jgi:hypothetical protein
VNKVLAETLSVLNGFFALLVIVAGGVAGKYMGPFYAQLYAQLNGLSYNQSQAEAFGITCGLIIGFFWAVVIFGLLALIVQIHRELKSIRKLVKEELRVERPLNRAEPRSRTLVPELSR